MTHAQTRLRDLRQRQSRERGRMAELSRVDSLSDETRAELDTIETGTPDLERQIRAATVVVEAEETEQRDAAATGNKEGLDTETASGRNSAPRHAWGATFKRQWRIGPLTAPRAS